MVITSGMMSSNTAEWSTPQNLFDRLNEEFHFGTDICATAENAKCPRYFTKEQDGLAHISEWTGAVWCNPPYGREIGRWVKACADYAEGGGDRGMSRPCTHRHALVEGALHEGHRDTPGGRKAEVR